jgi:glycosyltransferase involved in cell wall biosynthesis
VPDRGPAIAAGARIGVITTSYPRRPGDAAGGFVAGHVAYLRATGADVEVIAIGDGHPERHDDDHGVTRLDGGGLFYRGGAPEALEGGGATLRALAVSARMTAAIAGRARRWDAVVAHWLAPSALAAALAAGGRPLLAIAHGGDVHLLARTRLLGPALRLLHARGATVGFVSHALRQRALAGLSPALAAALRTTVQPMGVDATTIATVAALRAARAAARGPFTPARPATLLVLARLVPIKSIATAIAALPHLLTPARLLIAGDGPERAALTAAAAPLGARVHLLGQVDTAVRDRLLADADAVLVPSIARPDGREEGTPLAALEALAAGVRVIASATGGLVDLADRGAALVPPGDPRALARAIDRSLAGPPPAPAEVSWRVAGDVLDRAWGRVPRYAPDTIATQGPFAPRSDRPSS